jgi:hypothetical protein
MASDLYDAIEAAFAEDGLFGAFEPTGTSIEEWSDTFSDAIQDFFSVLGDTSQYRSREVLTQKMEILFDRTIGILIAINITVPLPVELIRKRVGAIISDELRNKNHNQYALVYYADHGIDLVKVVVDLIESGWKSESDGIADFPFHLSVPSPTIPDSSHDEESVAVSEAGYEIRVSRNIQRTLPIRLKLKKLKKLSDSNLINFGVSVNDLDILHKNLEGYLTYISEYLFDYKICSAPLLQIQANLVSRLIFVSGNSDDLFDDFASLIYFSLPVLLKSLLEVNGMLDNFILTILYPNLNSGKISEYKQYLTWMKHSGNSIRPPLVNLPTKMLNNFFLSDVRIKEEQLRSLELTTRIYGLWGNFADEDDLENTYPFVIMLMARHKSYLFACQIVSADTVYELISSIYFMLFNFACGYEGSSSFVKGFINGFYNKEYYPDDFIKMLEIAAYIISDDTSFSNPNLSDSRSPRFSAIARWFTPWYGMDFLDPDTSRQRGLIRRNKFTLNSKDFLGGFKKLYRGILKKWDLDNRVTPVPIEEIEGLKTAVVALLNKTEIDKDIFNLLFSEDDSEQLLSEDLREILLCFIKDELENALNVKLTPEFKLPKIWFQNPLEYKFFSGNHPELYPKWRDYAMETILKTDTQDKISQILNIVSNPLAAELELYLETYKLKKKKKKSLKVTGKPLYGLFVYLDTQFKFKPDLNIIDHELHKNIEILISGISHPEDRKVAKLASTWKFETFDEYMKIVALF